MRSPELDARYLKDAVFWLLAYAAAPFIGAKVCMAYGGSDRFDVVSSIFGLPWIMAGLGVSREFSNALIGMYALAMPLAINAVHYLRCTGRGIRSSGPWADAAIMLVLLSLLFKIARIGTGLHIPVYVSHITGGKALVIDFTYALAIGGGGLLTNIIVYAGAEPIVRKVILLWRQQRAEFTRGPVIEGVDTENAPSDREFWLNLQAGSTEKRSRLLATAMDLIKRTAMKAWVAFPRSSVTCHWSRRKRTYVAVGFGPYVGGKIYIAISAALHVSTPVLVTSLVHGRALVTGDYATPSAITIAYEYAIPMQLAWVTALLVTRRRGKKVSILLWIGVIFMSVVALKLAYVPSIDAGTPLSHYSARARLPMKDEIIFASVLFVINFIGCIAPGFVLSAIVKRLHPIFGCGAMKEVNVVPPVHWSKRHTYLTGIAFAPYACAKIYLYAAHFVGSTVPILRTSFVIKRGLLNGDFATASVLTIAYACAIPLHVWWYLAAWAERPLGKNMSPLAWATLTSLSVATCRMVYAQVNASGVPIEHRLSLTQMALKNEAISAAVVFGTNYLACALSCLAIIRLTRFVRGKFISNE